MIRKFCCTSAGESPIDGSSISSKRGLRHQRAAHRDHLLLAARQCAGELVRALLEPREQAVDALEIVVERAADPGARRRARGSHATVISGNSRRFSGTIAIPRRFAPAPAQLGHVLAVEQHPSEPRADEPEDRLQRRRLARRVAAEQADELALANASASIPSRIRICAVVGRDVVELRSTCLPFGFARVVTRASASASGSRPRYASTTAGWWPPASKRALGDLARRGRARPPDRSTLDDVHVVLDHQDRQRRARRAGARSARSPRASRSGSCRRPARRAGAASAGSRARGRSRAACRFA